MEISHTEGIDERCGKGGMKMMEITSGQNTGMKKGIREDIAGLTSWDKSSVLTILKEPKRVSVVRSEIIGMHTKRYTLTEEA